MDISGDTFGKIKACDFCTFIHCVFIGLNEKRRLSFLPWRFKKWI